MMVGMQTAAFPVLLLQRSATLTWGIRSSMQSGRGQPTPIIPGDTVNYIVEHYKAGNNGYMLEETEKLGDKIGANVTAEPKIYTGYTYNPDVAGSVTSGTLKKISSAADIVTLKLYYDLTVYTVTVEKRWEWFRICCSCFCNDGRENHADRNSKQWLSL